jgi:DNA-binding response OmpR family regulator
MRVLIAEDHVDTADSLALLLHLQGLDVHTVHDGPAALKAAQDFAPQVVVLDLGLPKLDGWEVARRLKASTKPPFIVAVTGHAREEDRRRSAEARIDVHLVKPIDPALLIQLVVRFRDKAAVAAQRPLDVGAPVLSRE